MTDGDAPGVASRDYDGPDLDGTVQHISERPYGRADGETVQVVDSEGEGEELTVGEPQLADPDQDDRPDDLTGQTTLTDYS